MKKKLIAIAYVLFIAVLLEFGIGQLGYRFTQGEWHSYEQAKQERNEIIAASVAWEREAADIDIKKSAQKSYRTEILHPYMGFVVDFHDDACPDIGFCDDRMRGYQPLLMGRDFLEAAPDRAIVAVTGGSFAYGVANNSTTGKIEEALASIPELQGKQIFVYTLAMGGFKQPQQLFALQYYLTMGAHFDMIINIDGFNEIVLPQVENLPFGTNPFFPRVWHTRVRSGMENYQAKMIQSTKFYLSMERANLAKTTNRDITRRSAVRGLIWKLQDRSLQKGIAEAETAYLAAAKSKPIISSRMITAGTNFPRDDEQWVLTQLAEFWRRSSEMMSEVAKAHDIPYYHFLQPNQYVDNSKPMGQEERAAAFLEGSSITPPYAAAARKGYPHLISSGQTLHRFGVAYRDLTMMFSDNEEVLYRDACCHLNTRGYDYVIDEIVEYITSIDSTQAGEQTVQ